MDAAPAPEVEVPGRNRAVALNEQSRAAHFARDGVLASKPQPERTPRQKLLRRHFLHCERPGEPSAARVGQRQRVPGHAILCAAPILAVRRLEIAAFGLFAAEHAGPIAVNFRGGHVLRGQDSSARLHDRTFVQRPGQIRLAAREDEGHLVVARPVEQEYASPARHRDGIERRDAPRGHHAARNQQIPVSPAQQIGAQRPVQDGDRQPAALVRLREEILAADVHIPVHDHRRNRQHSAAALESRRVFKPQRTFAGDQHAVKALKAAVIRAAAVDIAVAGDIQPQHAAERRRHIRHHPVRHVDRQRVIRLACPAQLPGGTLLPHCVREALEEVALLRPVERKIVIGSVRFPDGVTLVKADAVVRPRRKRHVKSEAFGRAAGLPRVVPEHARLRQRLRRWLRL